MVEVKIRLPDGVNQNLVIRGGVSLHIGIAHYNKIIINNRGTVSNLCSQLTG